MPDTSSPAKKLTAGEALAELWRRGELDFLLHETQVKIVEAFRASPAKVFVVNASRRTGKSFALIQTAFSYCLKHNDATVVFVAPTQKLAKLVVEQLSRDILKSCPSKYRPRPIQYVGYKFPTTNSTLLICGSESQNIERARGLTANLVLVDEARDIEDLKTAIVNVLLPTLRTTRGRLLCASTPPDSPSHYFSELCQKAAEDGALAEFTIYDNPMLTPQDIEDAIEECGGIDSTAFRREYLAQHCCETSVACIPELTTEKAAEIFVETPRPPFFHPCVFADLGYSKDLAVAAFSYYDFRNAKIVTEDELTFSRANSQTVANEINQRTKQIWPNYHGHISVWVDATPREIADLATHGLPCTKVNTQDLHALINELRILVQANKLAVDPRCKTIQAHLRWAIWDKNRKHIARSKGNGHFDGLMAIAYTARHIDRYTNPYPSDWDFRSLGPDRFYTADHGSLGQSENERHLINIFNPTLPSL